ncbi:hypothetical protein H5T53_04425 [Candidatus Bipolaricaulota bacterium]|nr:hypothetical protein [Candidatus Bipolaricaulota bacterium]
MIRYLSYEVRLALHPAVWLLPSLFAILRLTGVIRPESTGWLGFLEVMFPLLFPLLSFSLLERERNWRTLEVWVATPWRKAAALLVRYLSTLLPLFLTVVAAVRPEDYLLILSPGLLLGGLSLLFGLALGEEVGLGIGLAWWGVSFALGVTRPQILAHEVASWFLLMLSNAPLSPQQVLSRKWMHLGMGLLLLLLASASADHKRSWKPR